MKNVYKSVDAYVFGPNVELVVEAIAAAIGAVESCECVADYQFYEIAGCRLVVNPSEGGYFCYSLVASDRWKNDVDFARFLANATGRCVRCDPGSTFPDVSPYSDVFLQIEHGAESLIQWTSDTED